MIQAKGAGKGPHGDTASSTRAIGEESRLGFRLGRTWLIRGKWQRRYWMRGSVHQLRIAEYWLFLQSKWLVSSKKRPRSRNMWSNWFNSLLIASFYSFLFFYLSFVSFIGAPLRLCDTLHIIAFNRVCIHGGNSLRFIPFHVHIEGRLLEKEERGSWLTDMDRN